MKTLSDMRPVYVVGIGLHPYQNRSQTSYVTLGLRAVREALADAAITWPDVESAYVGNALIGMAAGAAMLRYLGATGIPFAQVENASASGSTAFRHAAHEVAAGYTDVSLAMGVDTVDQWRSGPAKAGVRGLADHLSAPFTHFAMLTQKYMDETGATPEQIAKVAVKNHRNGAFNPYAQRQQVRTLEEVLAPPLISGVLTRLQCTPVGEGAAAVIVMSEEGLTRHGIPRSRAVQVLASASRSEQPFGRENGDVALTRATTLEAYAQASVEPCDIDVVEVHDAFSIEELLYVEAMGFCKPGEAAAELEAGAFDIGGRHAVSPSGGLIAMGHPLGPTGVGQVAEVVRQLRGEAGVRQQPNARMGLTHMVGIGPVCLVHILRAATA
ncbi:thiolase family protein [Candidatus Amarobacter glycogenicus]|uniref:thiolase family protein n=1 Tax=Candidatus Amarobacter glycogenicus TaxID=3140699 RepID=UPI0031362C13|nr:thiolase family protein [Dehalococcoidia bacterium]